MNDHSMLILCVGPSGIGKTTYCSQLPDCEYIVICPDKLRGIIGKDESDQTVNGAVFQTVFRMTEYFLLYSKLRVVIDATNYSVKNRKDLIKIARKYNKAVIAWVFKCPIQIAKQRNQQRERKVPEEVIERQYNNLVEPKVPEEVDFVHAIDLSSSL